MKNIRERNERKEIRKISPFRSAHFLLPVYRSPIVSILTIFVPIWFLGWIGFGIFYVDFEEFQDRLAAIATLMIAYVTHLFIVKDELPKTSRPPLIYLLIYLSIGINIGCMIDSIVSRNETEQRWDTWVAILTIAYQGLFLLVVLIFIFLHQLKWKPSYTIRPGVEILVDTISWKNKECDEYFHRKRQDNASIGMKFIEYPSEKFS